jgi:hypothetical protein
VDFHRRGSSLNKKRTCGREGRERTITKSTEIESVGGESVRTLNDIYMLTTIIKSCLAIFTTTTATTPLLMASWWLWG